MCFGLIRLRSGLFQLIDVGWRKDANDILGDELLNVCIEAIEGPQTGK